MAKNTTEAADANQLEAAKQELADVCAELDKACLAQEAARLKAKELAAKRRVLQEKVAALTPKE